MPSCPVMIPDSHTDCQRCLSERQLPSVAGFAAGLPQWSTAVTRMLCVALQIEVCIKSRPDSTELLPESEPLAAMLEIKVGEVAERVPGTGHRLVPALGA